MGFLVGEAMLVGRRERRSKEQKEGKELQSVGWKFESGEVGAVGGELKGRLVGR